MNPSLSRRWWSLALNLIGIGFTSFDLVSYGLPGQSPLIAVLAWLTCALWLAAVLVPDQEGPARAALTLALIATGSSVAGFTDLVTFIPALVGVFTLVSQPFRPRWMVAGAITGLLALLSVGWVAAADPGRVFLTPLSILLIVVFASLGRRQYRVADARSRALLEERLAVEQERALVATLSERSRIARDLHDVLAHSLGGLVIQLEAVDALLESGRPKEARERVIAARRLAVAGLDEAKQAVSALREPADDPDSVVADLTATHRSLGGDVDVRERGDGHTVLPPETRTAFRRAVQELLTNARRHAPGTRTTLDLDWTADALVVRAVSPQPPGGHTGSSVGAGVGLKGMRERAEALGGTVTVRHDATFEVILTLPLKEGLS